MSNMSMVVAILRRSTLEQVRSELEKIDVTGMTAWEVHGYGNQMGHKETYRGVEHVDPFVPKVRLEIVVSELFLAKTIEIIEKTGRTGEYGDGKIFVLPVGQVVRI